MMARRRIVDEPTSRLAIWARRLAMFAVVVAVLAIIIVRSGLVETGPGIATFAAALILAAIGMVLAFGAAIVIWREGIGGFSYALLAVLVGVVLLAYPAYLGIKSRNLPTLADVTTDTADPPRFEAVARLRPRSANSVAYGGTQSADLQRAAYPDIEPLEIAATPLDAYNAALAVISKRKWRVVEARPPQTNRREGHIEAVARTAIMGFRDDVVVRVRTVRNGARVDIRSASRYGRHDYGTNAQRIRGLSEEIEETAAAATPTTGRIQPAARR